MKKPRGSELKTHILQQILKMPENEVWTANDFTALGSRSAIDKVLQRLVATGELRRIDRGLYDLFWAGRPAMRVVQALYWMQDLLSQKEERERTMQKLHKILADKDQGQTIREDLQQGLSGVPIWMQPMISELVGKHRQKE